MSLPRERRKAGQTPYRIIKLGEKFTKTRGNLEICVYGLRRRLPKFKGKIDYSQMRKDEQLCHNPSQAKCNNCGMPYCSLHLDMHRLSCWR